MSHHSLKFTSHGYCEAIFSTSPRSSNKENTVPAIKTKKNLYPPLSSESSGLTKGQNTNKVAQCSLKNVPSKPEIVETLGPPSKSSNAESSLKPINLAKQAHISSNITSIERNIKTPVKTTKFVSGSFNDKTSAIQFYTPKQSRITNTPSANTKFNVLSNARTPVKRYFSDNALSQSTPECFNTVHLETPSQKIDDIVVGEQTMYEGESSNLIVGIRIRPLNAKELNDPKVTTIVEGNGQNVIVECESAHHTFMYDHCFVSYNDLLTPGHASQEVVFRNMVLPLVQNAFEGYNVCLFAYGQTGSGKSYSLMGTESVQLSATPFDERVGIIPRFCQEIFSRACDNPHIETTIEISYFEIYNEKIHDLLANTNNGSKKAPLKVREHPVFGPYVVDLSQHCVQNYKDLQTWLKVGNSQRATAATGMNEKSSRSHSIFSIILTQTHLGNQLNCEPLDADRRSKINLVDLAGSERLSQTSATGDRLKEGVSINKSLLTLGKVIASLTENTNNRKQGFVPYRESVLTWLLKESLGGNSRTAMLGTVSPANIHVEETLATLRYACQARAIVNRIRINEDPHDRLIRELKAEVLRLRGVQEGYEKQCGVVPRQLLHRFDSKDKKWGKDIIRQQKEIDKLKDQLKKAEEQLAVTEMSSREKLERAEEKKSSELKYLRRCGIAIEIDFQERDKHPCLVNLTADPMLSGTLLYVMPPGLIRIGKNVPTHKLESTFKQLDILLDGPLVRELHCSIENNEKELILTPEKGADTYVNGQMVTGKILLKHNDRLVVGGNHYFRVLNPFDESCKRSTTQAIDFEFAHQEILRVQEEKLRAELEESKQKAIKELENAKREVEQQLGSQKSTYEREIEVLGSTLKEKNQALEQINRRKKELELEKELLVKEVEVNNKMKKIRLKQNHAKLSPYKSNFLQELEGILNEKTADIENVLKTKLNGETITAGGISLHEMQILVKEATQRCQEAGYLYEFEQQQTVVEKNLQSVIRVRDRTNSMEMLWQATDFLDWVHRLKNNDIEDSIKDLQSSKLNWECDESRRTEVFEDSLNNSKISINMTPVKRQLNESIHQFSMDASILEATMNDTSLIHDQQENVNACLTQIEIAAKTLKKLCHRYQNHDTKSIVESLAKMQDIVESLKNIFQSKDSSECEDVSADSINSANNTVIDMSNDIKNIFSNKDINEHKEKDAISIDSINSDLTKLAIEVAENCLKNMSPKRSSMRNNALDTKAENVQKTVRFFDKTEQ
ncbi:PREDICTED: kinesin-like protein KIF14 [Cyphomyrmex costatus]|uniref:Kinesin-like protein KIF14 n=1 Tax=Cyphomyrmex costatus TaxID=456900 RepID=A0A195CBG4_9HYME|nr:PREDICTED: kinesin-like protein KIF14 [Cyphomyrmex costatus]KYM98142.1 Kinesin-like protein KIF14 [Cyphomyrmex costatus]